MAANHHPIIFLLVATISIGFTQSLAQIDVNALAPRTSGRARSAAAASTITTALQVRRPRDSNWEDDTKSSRQNSEVTEYLPPWRDHQSGSQATPGKKARPFQDVSPDLPPMARMAQQVQQTVAGQLGGQVSNSETRGLAAPVAVVSAPRGGSSTVGGSGILLHNIKWPLIRDPPGVSSEFPLLMTRITVTVLSTLATWYLHLFNGYSSVLASSALTLLVSTCLDRRLGQAAFCGSFAGMCGGHLAPNLSMAMALGAMTSISYEVLIHINNFCLGIGGRLGATAFVATSILAKYQKVGSVGRKMRRGLWSSGGPSEIALTMVLFHMIGSVATIFLRECSDDSAAADPVRASSVIGLLGSLFISDPTSVLALYGGSFVGMALHPD